ncbi:MAG: hypothetical protein E7B17_12835, partial [Staphylococcus lugdunensis]|nr:hypothetical protein [Staphylococcus lugdunensis]
CSAHASIGGLAKQETGHPPVYSRPNDQAMITTAPMDSIGTQDFVLRILFCLAFGRILLKVI